LPKLVLINPVNSVNIFSFLQPKRAKSNGVAFVPPIGLGYIAALTPPHWKVKLLDESIIPFEFEDADLVGLTASTGQAPRAYEIAQIYRQKNIPVVMGGIHATMRIEEASKYVDSIVTLEAEEIWPKLLEDFERGRLKPLYQGSHINLNKNVIPRRDLFSSNYRFGSIMTSRGCPFDCDFCTVAMFNGSKLRHRPVKDVIDELPLIPQNMFLFVDDNLFGYSKKDKEHVKEIFREMIRLKIKKKWICQTSINSLDDESVLKLAKKSGCIGYFVGMESINEESLQAMEKSSNLRTGVDNYKNCLKKVHKHGMIVMGNFVMGYEKGLDEIYQDTHWMKKSPVDVVNFAILTPYPGTKVYDRFTKKEKIILKNYPTDWGFYDADHPVSKMDHLSLEDMYQGIEYRVKQLYSYPVLITRFFRTLLHTRSMAHAFWALFTNLFWVRRKNLARLKILESLMKREEYKNKNQKSIH
jgi:radical SAM superfamily enzyme YgiQ (UPF0313 family)